MWKSDDEFEILINTTFKFRIKKVASKLQILKYLKCEIEISNFH